MGEKDQIILRVDSSQKEAWDEFVEESGKYSSRSGLIRTAVEKEIHGEQQENDPSESPALSADVRDLKNDLERVRRDVRWLREQHQDEVDISDVAQAVRNELEALPKPVSEVSVPSDQDETDYQRELASRLVITPDDVDELEEHGMNDQTVEAIADRVGVSPDQVEDAIDHLLDQFLPIVSVEISGQTHYFMEG